MRTQTRLSKAVSFALALVTVFSLGAAPGIRAQAASSGSIQAEIDELSGQKDDIQARMDEIQAEIDSLDYEKANVLEKKEMLDQKNVLAQQELDVIQEQIDIVDGLVTNMQTDLDEARAEEENQKERWLTRVRAMEENSDLSYIEVLFNATSFSDFLTRLDLVNEVMTYDERLERDYIAARENVEFLESEAETLFAENETNKAELETKKAQLEADIDAACQLIEEMEQDIEQYNAMLEQERESQSEIEALIIEKEAELSAARAAEQAAAQERQRQSAVSGGETGSANTGSASGTWMMWPSYTTLITSGYGYRTNPVSGIYKLHSGVDIGASYGSAICAAAGGTVIYAGADNSGYGSYVIINHGNGYTTLYAHMSSIAVSVGQSVGMGDTVGYVGTTGNTNGPHLHFEVRSSASGGTMDPMAFSYY